MTEKQNSIVAEFKAGDLVPEWLLYIDPQNERSVKPTITFVVGGAVVLRNDRYWYLPDELEFQALIHIADGGNVDIGATAHGVVLPLSFLSFNAVEGAVA
jgi:hypothetical protein